MMDNQLRKNSLTQLIKSEIDLAQSVDDAVEGVLDFIRQWPQYRFGRYAMGVNRIQKEVAIDHNHQIADYSFFVSQVENLFSDASLIALDEYGIPFPLAKKLKARPSSDGLLDGALSKLKSLNVENLQISGFEKTLIEDAKQFI